MNILPQMRKVDMSNFNKKQHYHLYRFRPTKDNINQSKISSTYALKNDRSQTISNYQQHDKKTIGSRNSSKQGLKQRNYYDKIYTKKLKQIMEVLDSPQKKRKNCNNFKPFLNVDRNLKYQPIICQYLKLEHKKNVTYEILDNFISVLRQINPFFKKITSMISLVLIRVGQMKMYQSGMFLYRESEPINHISIIMWGQILLTKKYQHTKKYCFPGDSLGEEMLFGNNNNNKSQQVVHIIKGVYPQLQSAKAITNVGVLTITVDQYRGIYEQLAKIGEKKQIILVENMMKWSFSKKKSVHNLQKHLI